MPGQEDMREFDRIVERLRADDPRFTSRVERAADPAADRDLALRKPRRKLRAGMLGAAALFAIVLGGWAGLVIAVVITVWAVRLIVADRTDPDDDPGR